MNSTALDAARAAFMAGLAAQQHGQHGAAERCYRESLAHCPGRPSTLANLAATLLHLGRPDEALPLLDQALAAEPDQRAALLQRGLALAQLHRDADALLSFDRLLALDASQPAVWLHRALCLSRLGRTDTALASYDRAIALAPSLAEAHAARGGLLKDMGRHGDAATALQHAILLGADAESNGYLLASLGGQAAPPAAPAAYVERLFDDYAAGFEGHLVGELDYRVPQLLAASWRRHGPAGVAHAQGAQGAQATQNAHGRLHDTWALDLGCGTGLCAPLLRPCTHVLHGVDLSARMLQHAAARRLYDHLAHASIDAYLSNCTHRYDLVCAADVFIYLGALDAVFSGVRRVLKPGGLFCLSVELAGDDVDFELRPSTRYAQSARYVRALAQAHGFSTQRFDVATLRLEQRQPVQGLIVALAAPG